MTNATYTQGPWWLDEYGYVVAGSRETYLTIAEVDCSIFKKAEREANAHLIAAAPDLLAASEAFISELDSGSDFMAWEKAKADLRAAITKARGA